MKLFSRRLDKLEERLELKKEPKIYVHMVGLDERYPTEQELQKIKEAEGCDTLVIVSAGGGSE